MIAGKENAAGIRPGITLYDGMHDIVFRGDGDTSIIKVETTGTKKPQILFSSSDNHIVSNIRFTNLKFVGDPTNPNKNSPEIDRKLFWSNKAGSAIRIMWWDNLTIDNCVFENFPILAVGGSSGTDPSIQNGIISLKPKQSYNFNFHHNKVTTTDHHVCAAAIVFDGNVVGLLVVNNEFERCSRALALEIDNPFMEIHNVIFANNTCRNGLFSSGKFMYDGGSVIQVHVDANEGGAPSSAIQNVIIANNTFENTDNSNASYEGADIWVRGEYTGPKPKQEGDLQLNLKKNEFSGMSWMVKEQTIFSKYQSMDTKKLLEELEKTLPWDTITTKHVIISGNTSMMFNPSIKMKDSTKPCSNLRIWRAEDVMIAGNTIEGGQQLMKRAIYIDDARHVYVVGNKIDGNYVQHIVEDSTMPLHNVYIDNDPNTQPIMKAASKSIYFP
jgi:hypothetical protein